MLLGNITLTSWTVHVQFVGNWDMEMFKYCEKGSSVMWNTWQHQVKTIIISSRLVGCTTVVAHGSSMRFQRGKNRRDWSRVVPAAMYIESTKKTSLHPKAEPTDFCALAPPRPSHPIQQPACLAAGNPRSSLSYQSIDVATRSSNWPCPKGHTASIPDVHDNCDEPVIFTIPTDVLLIFHVCEYIV